MPRELPLHRIYASMGAAFTEAQEWLVPLHFGDPHQEVSAVRGAAGILDLSATTLLELSGPDSVRFLHRMVTNDIEKLPPGAGCRAALLEHKGRLLADLRILRTQEALLVLVPAVAGPTVVDFLERHIIADRVSVRDLAAESVFLSVQGPHAPDVCLKLIGQSSEGQSRHAHQELLAGAEPLRLVYSDHTGESGFDILARRGYAEELLESLMGAGHDFGIRPVGCQAWNILRIESGIPWYGADMDSSNLVQEVLMEEAVSFSKGCYVGQETVARLRTRGHVNRHLCGFRFEGEPVPESGSRVFVGDTEVGWLTSSVFSPSLGQAIAIGFIRRESYQPGQSVRAISGDRAYPGTISALPIYQPAIMAHQGE